MVNTPNGTINVDPEALDQLHSADARLLFKMFNELSTIDVSRIVELPQIIVVGDQSSGKSSLLQAISRLHFPIHNDVCTRFPTELILQEGLQNRVKATVYFRSSSSSRKPFIVQQDEEFDQRNLTSIFDKARAQMHFPDARSYSQDVLRLEIEGPGLLPLTLVDLPGLYHAETDKQSSDGIEQVKEIVREYMKSPRSIILAVISASNQLANQMVMQEIQSFDPLGERTLGIVTKPDLLPTGSSEEAAYNGLIRGNSSTNKLALGWHVVRNRADHEAKLEPGYEETIEADFFKTRNWPLIPSANRGISALRKRLSLILHEHLKKKLHLVESDIEKQLSRRVDERNKLGQPRSTPEEMRVFLSDVAMRYRLLVEDGIQGSYNDDKFFGDLDESGRKLRAHLRIFKRAIHYLLLSRGSTRRIECCSKEPDEPPAFVNEYIVKYRYHEAIDLPGMVSKKDLIKELEDHAASNQGMEPPSFANHRLVFQLFRKQSEPWEGVVLLHLEIVTNVVRVFVEEVFEYIIAQSDASTAAAIRASYVDSFFDRQPAVLVTKLKEIIRPYKEGYALPPDEEFLRALEARKTIKALKTRILNGRDKNKNKASSHYTKEDENDDHDETEAEHENEYGSGYENDDDDDDEDEDEEGGPSRANRVNDSQDSRQFDAESIIDAMLTLYEMSLRTFSDNVNNLLIESCLVRELTSVFTPSIVGKLDDMQLGQLAAEPEEISQRRKQLSEDIDLLEKGLRKCRRYRPRGPVSSEYKRKDFTFVHRGIR